MNRLTNKYINWYNDFVFSLRNRLITTDEINDSIYNRLKLLEELRPKKVIDYSDEEEEDTDEENMSENS